VIDALADATERWRPRRLAWLRLAASRACSKMSLVTQRRSVIRSSLRKRPSGSETQPHQPAGTPAFHRRRFALPRGPRAWLRRRAELRLRAQSL